MTDDYRALFAGSPQPMFVFDRETLAIVEINDAACALYEWSRDEMLAMTLRDIRNPEDLPRLDHVLADLRGQQGPFHRAGRHRTKSGKTLEIELDMTRLSFGGRACTLVVVTNNTGRSELERRIRVLAEHSNEGVSIWGPGRTLEFMSAAGERLLGVAPGALIGTSASAMMHPEDRANFPPLAPGVTRTQIVRSRHPDGTWHYMESTATNLLLDPGVRGVVSNFRDVTERVKNEHALRDAHHRLEYLLSATSAITYSAMAGAEYGATYISPSVREVLGWEPSVFMESPSFWRNNIHPDDQAAVLAAMATLLEVGAYTFEYRFRHGDGSWRWILDDARVVRDPAGGPPELVGYMIDVTARRAAEESLRRSESNFRMLIERSPVAVLVHREGTLVYGNPAAVVMFGYESPDELVGRSILDLIHPDDHDQIRSKITRTIRYGSTPPTEARVCRRDGSYFVMEAEALYLDFDGTPSSVVLGRDVTERRELYERMAVADRMLSVGTLAAGVAHEINNPLAYVLSNLELLARELPALRSGAAMRLQPNELETLVADARDGADRVGAIVRDLRALSRSDDESTGAVDIATVLASCVKMAHNEIRHRARVTQDLAAGLPAVVGSSSRLGQVFLNLLVNAAQAIPEGRADANEIRVRAFLDAESRLVVIEIADTGVGIPRAVIGRIFDPFFTTKPVGHGIGLGLSISHEIVRSVGGTIIVDSAIGTGTTFRVALPVAPEHAIAPASAAVPQPGAVVRVLVIDDEVAVGRSIALLLAPEYDVTPVTRAQAALTRLADGERYDAIVCDVMMPEMSGIEFFHQLARSAPEHVRRLVFLTGGAFTQQAREFLAQAACPQLQKPFSEHELRRAIDAVRGHEQG